MSHAPHPFSSDFSSPEGNATGQPASEPSGRSSSVPVLEITVVASMVVVAIGALVWLGTRSKPGGGEPGATLEAAARAEPDPDMIERLAEERQKLDQSLWADEVLAQEYETPIVRLWDDLRACVDPLPILNRVPFDRITIGAPGEATELDLGIEQRNLEGPGRTLDADAWRAWLEDWSDRGLTLVQSEWHHARFEPPGEDGRARSDVSMTLHLEQPGKPPRRWIVEGKLHVTWKPRPSKEATPEPETIDARSLRILERAGNPPFRIAATLDPWPNPLMGQRRAPLILRDLDGDGLSELIAPASNVVFRNQGDFTFKREAFLDHPPKSRETAYDAGLIADFNGDGHPDFLGAGTTLSLHFGDASGRFARPPITPVGPPPLEFALPSVITAGDVDGDGDLDVWLAQYLGPYTGGQMPTPFYDALDGPPSYLLINDGEGRFTDATESAGLAPKRHRRTYSTSFVDLDGDRDLDLITINDFAGLDIHLNDGEGRFTEVTERFVDHRHSFGMSHVLTDIDGDALVDLYMTGMGSTTARRLEALGLGRSDAEDINRMRGPMGYGNRLYTAARDEKGARLEQVPWNDHVARTGWSWGAVGFDFDLDGDRDLYVANGNISNETARDYCTRYWTHDIYLGDSKPDPTLARFFSNVLEKELGQMSWNGFEHNNLLINLDKNAFVNVGFLMGVAFEFDARNVAADDLDGDGRVDLVVAEKPLESAPVFHVLKNEGDFDGHWVGLRFREPGPGRTLMGTEIRLEAGDLRLADVIVSGDSYKTQHALVVHFGLGEIDQVDRITIRWPGGAKQTLEAPPIDAYVEVEPASGLELGAAEPRRSSIKRPNSATWSRATASTE